MNREILFRGREEITGAWSRFVPLTRPPQSWCYVEEVTLWASEIEEFPMAVTRARFGGDGLGS